MSHADTCRAGCSNPPKLNELLKNHGTPLEFEAAVWNAIGVISIAEARAAVMLYRKEWEEAAGRVHV
jgi:hypothetical protein